MRDQIHSAFGSAIPRIEIETEIDGDLRRHESRERFPRHILFVDADNQPRLLKLVVRSPDKGSERAIPALLKNCSEHGLSIVSAASFHEGESLLVRAQDISRGELVFEEIYSVQRRRKDQHGATGKQNAKNQEIYTFGTLVGESIEVEDSAGRPMYTYGLHCQRRNPGQLYKALYDSVLFEYLRAVKGFKASMFFDLLEHIAR